MTYPIQPRVLIDGEEVAPDEGGADSALATGHPYLDPDSVTFTWGRQSITDQPDQGTASFTIYQQTVGQDGNPFGSAPFTVASLFLTLHTGSVVQIRSLDTTTGRDVLMWAGEITEVDIQPVTPFRLSAAVSCTDASTILGNIDIGDDPWPQESAFDRYQHILDAAGLKIRDLRPTSEPSPDWRWNLTGDMDDTIKDQVVAFRDVDSQPPLDLIQQLAVSVGGIAWITADDDGPSIWIEDPTQRKGLRQFVIDPDTGKITIGQLSLDLADVNRWTADDIVPHDVAWKQDPTQSINVVDVNWQQNDGLNDQGNPQYNSVTIQVADSDSNKGIRMLGPIDTQLVADADARRLATLWLAQAQAADWIMSGLAIDTDLLNRPATVIDQADRLSRVMDLLDIRVRIGYRVTVTELPTWAPGGIEQSYYIEGGTYSWSSSRWQLQLIASSNAIGGGATFNQFPTGTKIKDFAGLRGRDMWGAAAPGLSAAIVPFAIPVMI